MKARMKRRSWRLYHIFPNIRKCWSQACAYHLLQSTCRNTVQDLLSSDVHSNAKTTTQFIATSCAWTKFALFFSFVLTLDHTYDQAIQATAIINMPSTISTLDNVQLADLVKKMLLIYRNKLGSRISPKKKTLTNLSFLRSIRKCSVCDPVGTIRYSFT